MNIKYRTQGVVFQKDNRTESDQDFSVLTEDFGRLELRARAIRKITSKLRSNIDVLYLSEIEFIQGKNLKTLTDAITIKKFHRIASDFRKSEIVYKVFDVLNVFIKGQERDENTFNFLSAFLIGLENSSLKSSNQQLPYEYFFWNFVSLQGYKLQVQVCSHCLKKIGAVAVYFSYKEGGVLCKDCIKFDRYAKKINADVVKILRLILNRRWDIVSRLKVESDTARLLQVTSEGAIHAFSPS